MNHCFERSMKWGDNMAKELPLTQMTSAAG